MTKILHLRDPLDHQERRLAGKNGGWAADFVRKARARGQGLLPRDLLQSCVWGGTVNLARKVELERAHRQQNSLNSAEEISADNPVNKDQLMSEVQRRCDQIVTQFPLEGQQIVDRVTRENEQLKMQEHPAERSMPLSSSARLTAPKSQRKRSRRKLGEPQFVKSNGFSYSNSNSSLQATPATVLLEGPVSSESIIQARVVERGTESVVNGLGTSAIRPSNSPSYTAADEEAALNGLIALGIPPNNNPNPT